MFDELFTHKCMALVGENGHALTGPSLQAAEEALTAAKKSGMKLWSDRNGYFWQKKRELFVSAEPVRDAAGKQVRICGKAVKVKAKFCSKCGSPAPGGWWRCGQCGRPIGNESKNCPHCGRMQNPLERISIAGGIWQKDPEVFAERFDYEEIRSLLPEGLNIQENQLAILLDGGSATYILEPGFCKAAELTGPEGIERSIVMLDSSEFSINLCVKDIRTADDLTSDLHAVLNLAFDKTNAVSFMKNLMGCSQYLERNSINSSIGYDEIAQTLLLNVDAFIREFCAECKVDELFKDATLRIHLEDSLSIKLNRELAAFGLKFIRLKRADFESEVFESLREKSGQVEEKRREIEFMLRADELANKAARTEALSEHEMDEYVSQLAHEKGIRQELRDQELERLHFFREKEQLRLELEKGDMTHESMLSQKYREMENQEDIRDLQHKRELERRIEEQKTSLESMKISEEIGEVKSRMQLREARTEQEITLGWEKIRQEKEKFKLQQKIEMINAASGADMRALLMAEEDPEKRASLLQLYEQELQSKMTPELLLAAAAARGNANAAAAIGCMNQAQKDAIEHSKDENRQIYDRMLKMNEEMFNKVAESCNAPLLSRAALRKRSKKVDFFRLGSPFTAVHQFFKLLPH